MAQHVGTQQEGICLQTRKRVFPTNWMAVTLTFNFQPSECEDLFSLFKASRMVFLEQQPQLTKTFDIVKSSASQWLLYLYTQLPAHVSCLCFSLTPFISFWVLTSRVFNIRNSTNSLFKAGQAFSMTRPQIILASIHCPIPKPLPSF